jgi:YgaB-like protein
VSFFGSNYNQKRFKTIKVVKYYPYNTKSEKLLFINYKRQNFCFLYISSQRIVESYVEFNIIRYIDFSLTGRREEKMNFEQLVGEQLKTMDKLLYLQSEIERCQDIKQQLIALQDEANVHSVQDEIEQMKIELNRIQEVFEQQTEEVIRTYENQRFETVS